MWALNLVILWGLNRRNNLTLLADQWSHWILVGLTQISQNDASDLKNHSWRTFVKLNISVSDKLILWFSYVCRVSTFLSILNGCFCQNRIQIKQHCSGSNQVFVDQGLAGLDNCSETRVNFTRCSIGTATLSSFNFLRF